MEGLVSLEREAHVDKVSPLVYRALVRLLGKEHAEVVDFYVDSRLAVQEPERYEAAVQELLGEAAGRMVISGIRTELARACRTQRPWDGSLLNGVRVAQKALSRPLVLHDR